MKYLILRSFRSYGVTLHKGEVVDEAQIRSPRLRRSEGKIIPAVSSSAASEEKVVAAPTPAGAATFEDSISNADKEPEGTASAETTETNAEKPKFSLSFGK